MSSKTVTKLRKRSTAELGSHSPLGDRQAHLSGADRANYGAKRSYHSAHGGPSGTPVPTRKWDSEDIVPSNSRFAVDFRAEICYTKRRKAVLS